MTVTRDLALAQAAEADARFKAGGPRGPLDGVPIALKDVFCTRGIRTSCGSKILEGFVPPYDATAYERLRAAGAVLLGKLNMDEFAMGSSTENSAYFTTRNPWDLDRVPGGSSGGSSAAVAADLAAASFGTDTGGSIRQPAAFCGIVGLKPTYGRVSRYGLVAFASSLDQIGPFTKTVADAARVLQVIAGADPHGLHRGGRSPCPTTWRRWRAAWHGLRIGIPREYFIDGMDPEVERAVRATVEVLRGLGAKTEDVSLPHTEYGLAAYYLIGPAEASSNLARYDGVKYGLRVSGGRDLVEMSSKTRAAGFGREVKRRIMLGRLCAVRRLSRRLLRPGAAGAHLGGPRLSSAPSRRCDAIVAPTTPGVGVQDRREGGPDPDVPQRRVHRPGEPGGAARDLGAGRLHAGGAAHRRAGDRTRLRRGHRAARGPCLRAGHRLAHPEAQRWRRGPDERRGLTRPSSGSRCTRTS